MNWAQIEGKWKEYSGKAKEKWGKLTDDDLTVINGKREQLVGKLQERYGLAKEEVDKQIEEFSATLPIDSHKEVDRTKAQGTGR